MRGAFERDKWSWEILWKGERTEEGDRQELQRLIGCGPFDTPEEAISEADLLWLAGNNLTST